MKIHLPSHSLRSGLPLGLLTALALALPPACAAVSSNFDLDAEGWTLSGDIEGYDYNSETPPSLVAPTYYSTNGAPGGYIEHSDLGSSANVYFVAPDAYRGNLSAYAGGTLSYSLRINSAVVATPSTFAPAYDVVIISPLATIMLPYQITLENNPINFGYTLTGHVTDAGWHDYSFGLSASQGWQFRLNSGGTFATATDEQIRLVLGNVAVFTILGEYLNGTEYGNLDSVRLLTSAEQASAVPEPSGCALLGGLATLGFAAIRRRPRRW